MSANSMSKLSAKVLFRLHQIMAEHEGFVPKATLQESLESTLELNDWELESAGKSGTPRWRNALWSTTESVKAGFMVKSAGRWRITEAGRKALELGEAHFYQAVRDGYREWTQERDGDEDSAVKVGREVRGKIMRQGLLVLSQSPGRQLDRDELIRRTARRLPEDIVEALEESYDDWMTAYGLRSFGRAARAGWMTKNSGSWILTASGTAALEEWTDSTTLWQMARSVAGDTDEKELIPYHGPVADLARVPQALYRTHTATVSHLVGDLQQGTLALPDIQRPFVWKNTKVRDLLDSLFRGYPFGFILTWKSPFDATTRRIGTDPSGRAAPYALVIDGQQRLTSLFAVMTGRPVMDDNFRERRIQIGFHPIQGAFSVADATLDRNPEWLPDVSRIFTESLGALSVVREYLGRLKEAREIAPGLERVIETNIERLVNLRNLPVNVLEIGVEANEEEVAEIFVRINSKGQNLRQADFILTLLAVFWEEGREQLEAFARDCHRPSADGSASPFNHKLRPGPDDLVRVAVAVGHRRARLSAAYQVLRGKDPRTGEVTAEAREKNLAQLEEAQNYVLKVQNWHEFLKVLSNAGYRHKRIIQSSVTALNAYALFLIGRETLKVPLADLRRIIGRWFVMSAITSRYVGGSSETAMEEDLARLRGISTAEGFASALEDAMNKELTNDFWEVTLPSRLESSSLRSLSPFFAAQSVIGAKALYSNLSVAELLDPSQSSTKEDLEIHHLFPKGWLKSNGYGSARDYNQIANLSLLEWSANIEVSDEDPSVYAPRLEQRLIADDLETCYETHALPSAWFEMDYEDFLAERRLRIAKVIRAGFERIR
jgi:hypothetical protein